MMESTRRQRRQKNMALTAQTLTRTRVVKAKMEDEANDIVHISKKELRDMVLAAAKTALSMSKRMTRKVQRGNEAKTKKRTALRKEKDMDKGWERRLFCVSSLDSQTTSTNDLAIEIRS